MFRHGRYGAIVTCFSSLILVGCQAIGQPEPPPPPPKPAPAPIVVEAEPKTITVVRTEVSPTLTELSLFSQASVDDRKSLLKQLRLDHTNLATAENALRYGGALVLIARGAKTLRRAEKLLKRATEDDETGLAEILLDQTRKRLELLAESRQKQSQMEDAKISETNTQVAEQNETINQLRLDNLQLRSALNEAEAKIRELAQIEAELAKPKRKTSP